MLDIQYTATDDATTVYVREKRERPNTPCPQYRRMTRSFGEGIKARDDALVFVHGVQHGDIKADDILPPWTD